MKRARILIFSLVFLAGFSGAYNTHAASYVQLFYYRPGPAADQAVYAHANSIDILAPDTYSLAASGVLTGSTSPAIVQFAAAHGIKIMPVVSNGVFEPAVAQAILNNPTVQGAAISELINEAKACGYWGWQIDFEAMDASERDLFSAFVANAATALHQNGLALSVAIVAKTSDEPADYPADFWQNWVGAYDYSTLAQNADFVTVMSYDEPDSGGPIAGLLWVKKVLTYSLAHIPAAKISLGIPLYYYEWNEKTGTRVAESGNQNMTALLKAHASTASFFYSAVNQEPYFTFKAGGIPYAVWYENTESLAAKIALVKKYNLAGFSAWRIGLEAPSIYLIF